MLISLAMPTFAQQQQLTREQILAMTTDELSDLPLEDLMHAVETLGVASVDELFALIMNKNVSSASKEEESSFTSQLATTVITRDEMRSYGCTTLEEAFRLIPGAIVSQKSNGVYDIHLRGLNNVPDNHLLLYNENNNTQLMVDGRIVQSMFTGTIRLHELPISIEDIERIEVVRGACSALYGMNAVMGIINIITEKPSQDSKAVSGSLMMGNNGTYVADAALRKAINDKWAFSLSLNGQMRQRNNNKIYLIPRPDLYYDASGDNDPALLSNEDFAQRVADGKLVEIFDGGYYSVEDLKSVRTTIAYGATQRFLSNINETEANLNDMFPDPSLSRKNIGINGHISFVPKPDVRFDLSGGYQNSNNVTLSPTQDYFAQVYQVSKTSYANLQGQVKDLNFQLSYTGGPQTLAQGVAGMKVISNNFNVQANYDIHIGSEFQLRPEFSFLYLKYYNAGNNLYDYGDGNGPQKLSGFLDGAPELSIISPSLRAQWAHKGFKLTAAIRADKTSKPDQWNVSYQGAASYQFNADNFLRVVYGRAYRATNMINTSSDYTWLRTTMVMPNVMHLAGSTEADLMKTDNIEIGYRWKPSPKLLIDAEAFMSKSTDFGGLMSQRSCETLEQSTFENVQRQLGSQMTPELIAEMQSDSNKAKQVVGNVVGQLLGQMKTVSTMVYKNLPYEVYQMGLSLNMDWIISPKLIFKLNANVQRTRIDNYYAYSQNDEIRRQIIGAIGLTTGALSELVAGSLSSPTYTQDAFGLANYNDFAANSGWEQWSAEDQADFCNKLLAFYKANGSHEVEMETPYDGAQHATEKIDLPLTMYYALKYKVRYRLSDNGTEYYECGSSEVEEPELEDKKHFKATPAFYGMCGFIFKPIPQLNVSAFCNIMGQRTYETTYSRELVNNAYDDTELTHLSPKCTLNLKVGYKPSDEVELFFTGNNLFNDKAREMVFSDKVGGLYTVGVNFRF